MSFGAKLRELREAKGWSRHQLEIKMNGLLSEAGIKALELSANQEPHNGTRANLLRLFPELDNTIPINAGIRQNYPTVNRNSLVMRK
jgi:transcriptional regulator with XRE-family HTH domain